MSRPFHFRQFSLTQQNAAMKAGADNVLFGAWANYFKANKILDIGTGTGLLSLMSAQANPGAAVIAIEPEAGAARDAATNFQLSPFAEQIILQQVPLEDFIPEPAILFDHIICNPPFFREQVKSPDHARSLARTITQLNPTAVFNARQWLRAHGRISIIVPASDHFYWTAAALENRLWLRRKALVSAKEGKPPHLLMLSYTLEKEEPEEEIIEMFNKAGDPGMRYLQLVSPYYIQPPSSRSFS